jgi:hypothetical protein
MKKAASCLVLLLCFINYAAADNLPSSLQGNWSGVWYVGMSSGKVNLRLEANGDGRISFTNFEEFSNSDTVENDPSTYLIDLKKYFIRYFIINKYVIVSNIIYGWCLFFVN